MTCSARQIAGLALDMTAEIKPELRETSLLGQTVSWPKTARPALRASGVVVMHCQAGRCLSKSETRALARKAGTRWHRNDLGPNRVGAPKRVIVRDDRAPRHLHTVLISELAQ